MKTKLENAGPCRKLLHVSAPTDEVMPEYNNVLKAYRKQARIPGFRKGKAPEAVVERRFKNELMEDAKDRLVPQLYREAIEKEKANPIAVVDVHDVEFEKGSGLSFQVTLDVAPDFKLPRYKKISVKSKKAAIEDKAVDEAIEKMRESSARYEEAGDREVKDGDFIKCDFTGEIDGKPIADVSEEAAVVSKGSDFSLMVGEADIIPGLSAGVTGAKREEEREVDVEFPSDYRLKSLCGKKATYKVKVTGIRERVLPEMDEEFAKKFDADSMSALQDMIRKELLEGAERTEKERLKGEIVQHLLAKVKMDVPQSVVEQEKNAMVRNIVNRIAMQGANKDQIEAQRDTILEEASKSSEERVRSSYILSKIADEEEISVEDKELDDKIVEMSQRYGMPPEKFRAEMEKRNSIEGLRSEIRAEKTLEFLFEHAKIK
jgi:trigger factor